MRKDNVVYHKLFFFLFSKARHKKELGLKMINIKNFLVWLSLPQGVNIHLFSLSFQGRFMLNHCLYNLNSKTSNYTYYFLLEWLNPDLSVEWNNHNHWYTVVEYKGIQHKASMIPILKHQDDNLNSYSIISIISIISIPSKNHEQCL